MAKHLCQQCGATFFRHGRRQRKFCSRACSTEATIKPESNRHFTVRSSGKRRGLHVLIAERVLGHALGAKAKVHHVNGNKRDNQHSNLVICEDQRYHCLLHARMRRLRQTGSLDLKQCKKCGQTLPLAAFCLNKRQWDGRSHCCKTCENTRTRLAKQAHA